MAVLPVLICFAAFAAVARGLDYKDDAEFTQWLSRYHDGAQDPEQLYPTWKSNADFVRQHNSKDGTFKLSLNKFAHLTPRDLIRSKVALPSLDLQIKAFPSKSDALPPSVDWRTKGVVPPVRNQGQCGSGAAFAVVGAVDALHAIETGQLVLGSEAEFQDCCFAQPPPCNCGGSVFSSAEAYKCIVDIGGLDDEGSYSSPNCKCLNDSSKAAITIKGGRMVQSGNETALQAAVVMQPVLVLVDASHSSFQFYQSGIYNQVPCSSTNLDHTLLVVGYGSERGLDYWIAQNSWGTSWGIEGYILMSRNKNNQCGIATAASYPY